MGLYLGGAHANRFRQHAAGCKRGSFSLDAPCCANAEIRVKSVVRMITTSDDLRRKVQLIRDGSPSVSAVVKKSLPAVTPSALYIGPRQLDQTAFPTGIIVLDFDNVDEPETLRDMASWQRPAQPLHRRDRKPLPCTIASFISAGGRGVKVLVHVSPLPRTPDDHRRAFQTVADAFAGFGEPDPSGKDMTRLCFLSYDPDARYNPATWAVRWD